MHTLEEHRKEVVQGNQEGVGPLAGEIRSKSRILFGCGDKRQDEPVSPLGLTLQLDSLLLEKLLSLLQVSFLAGEKKRETVTPRPRNTVKTYILCICLTWMVLIT